MSARSQYLITWKATDKGPGGVLSFDAVMSDNLEDSATVTEFPVESGAPITDHVRSNPTKLTMDVIVSDTPIDGHNNVNPDAPRGSLSSVALELPSPPALSGLTGLLRKGVALLFGGGSLATRASVITFDSDFSAIAETRDVLLQIMQEGRLVDVVSRDWFIDNMVIESIGKPRSPEDGSIARFSLAFKHIRIVETRQSLAPVPAEVRAKSAVDVGKKDPTGTDAKKKSILKSGADTDTGKAITGFLFGGL